MEPDFCYTQTPVKRINIFKSIIDIFRYNSDQMTGNGRGGGGVNTYLS